MVAGGICLQLPITTLMPLSRNWNCNNSYSSCVVYSCLVILRPSARFLLRPLAVVQHYKNGGFFKILKKSICLRPLSSAPSSQLWVPRDPKHGTVFKNVAVTQFWHLWLIRTHISDICIAHCIRNVLFSMSCYHTAWCKWLRICCQSQRICRVSSRLTNDTGIRSHTSLLHRFLVVIRSRDTAKKPILFCQFFIIIIIIYLLKTQLKLTMVM